MHKDANLLSLDQRRKIQLLSLMFIHKHTHNVQRPVRRLTRGGDRFRFHLERYNNVKYKNSPYYKGSEQWDTLPRSTITCDTLFDFKDRQQLVGRLLRCCHFLCAYVLYIHTLYIK